MRKISIFLFAQLLFFAGLSPDILAEETKKYVANDETAISTNIFGIFSDQTSQSIKVITRDEIKKLKATTVPEVLRTVTGVDLVNLGSPGEDTDVRIRGSDRDEVLVMIDGVAVNSLLDARATILSTIPVDLVEEIEVVRGALSVLYGSDAAGGVINIITKKDTAAPELSIGFDAGNLAKFKETVVGLKQMGRHFFGTSFSRTDQKGRFDNDRFGQNAFFFNYSFHISSKSHLSTQFVFLNNNQELAFDPVFAFAVPVPIYVLQDTNRQIEKNIVIPQIIFETKSWDFYNLRVSYGMYFEKQNLENSNIGDTVPDPTITLNSQLFKSTGHRHSFDLRNTFHIIDSENFKSSIILGTAGILEFFKYTDSAFPGDVSVRPTTVYPDTTLGQKDMRRTVAGYILNTISVKDNFFLSMGFRYDDNDTYGHATSPRFSINYVVPHLKTKLFSTYAQGFKAPTLSEYYIAFTDGTGVQLSQRLSKETNQIYEIGASQELFDKLELGLTYFYTKYDGFIDDLQLVNNAHISGMELDVTAKIVSWLKLSSNYTYMQSINETDGSSLANRPRHQFNFAVDVNPLKNLDLHLDVQAFSHRIIPGIFSTQAFGDLPIAYFDAGGASIGTTLPSYYTVNLAARYKQQMHSKVIKELNYSISVKNLLNKSYQESAGFPQTKLTFLAGIEAKF